MDGSIFYLVDKIPNNCSLGIDLYFFQNKDGDDGDIKGIRNISKGIHVLHLTNHEINSRVGKIINVEENNVYQVQFLTKIVDEEIKIGEDYEIEINKISEYDYEKLDLASAFKMVNYTLLYEKINSKDFVRWEDFKFDLSLFKFIKNGSGIIRTEDCSSVELKKLREEIVKDNNHQGGINANRFTKTMLDNWDSNELVLTELEFSKRDKRQLVRMERVGSDRTADFLDKSWFVEERWGSGCGVVAAAVAELKFALLAAAVVNNAACAGHFSRLAHVLLGSARLLARDSEAAAVGELFRFLCAAARALRSMQSPSETSILSELAADAAALLDSDTVDVLPLEAAFHCGQLLSLLNVASSLEAED